MFFQYGEKELAYLRERDSRLGAVINKVGFIEREVHGDIFNELVISIAGQQISNSALKTVCSRIHAAAGGITAESVLNLGADGLRSCGVSLRKAENIVLIAEKAISGEFVPDELFKMSDDDVIKKLTEFRGVGPWTARMILIFCLNRPNVFSFEDFGIRRGIELLYGEIKPGRTIMQKYYERYSPYATVASFYLWKVGNGEISPDEL